MKHYTRFRSYQLPNPGSSFSFSVEKNFTLIEARYNDTNAPHVKWEMQLLGIKFIDTLHITSWDQDHCNYGELCTILDTLLPTTVEYPSETPITENGKKSLSAIQNYKNGHDFCRLFSVSPYVVQYTTRHKLMGENVFYNPIVNGDKSNNNSVVKLFRTGSFTVLSLGDCEDVNIAKELMKDDILTDEVDVMILAHHGADNGFTTVDFLKAINPKVCVCSSDYGNEYDHPRNVIRGRCNALGIPLFTTKRGDIIAQTQDTYNFKVSNYVSNNEVKDSVLSFENKTWFKSDVE